MLQPARRKYRKEQKAVTRGFLIPVVQLSPSVSLA